MKPRKIVCIYWEDAAAFGSNWGYFNGEADPYMVYTVGIELYNTKRGVTVADSWANNGLTCGETFIPRGMIRKRKVLGTVAHK